ncbi:MAG: hypothetical protein GXY48_12290 [Methanomicrobiales archaeon]|nr:hypothetical protein [Methanomicrobiales archaeon]
MNGPLSIDIVFSVDEVVTITGTFEGDDGRLSGTFGKFNQLKGTWAEAPSYSGDKDSGGFTFTFSDDLTSFYGTYSYGTTPGFAGEWNGKGSN